jgi:SAM-dependent methyltransferase
MALLSGAHHTARVTGARSDGKSARQVMRAAVPRPVRRAMWALSLWLQEAQQRVFERILGVSTSGHVYFDELSADRVFYEGCEWIPLRRVLRRLRPGPSDVFVDIGSGKGQALFIAARLPYGRVRGVEVMDSLVAEAEENARLARPKLRCQDVRTEHVDALEWEVPDDLSTVFMYCPFSGELFHRVLDRVFASYDRNPRPLRLVYDFPWEHNWLVSTGRVVVEDVQPAQWPAKPWWWRTAWVIVTYRIVGTGEGGPTVPDVRRRLFRPGRALRRWGGTNDQRFRVLRGEEVVASH